MSVPLHPPGTWTGSVRDVLAVEDTVIITPKIEDDGSYTGTPSRGNSFTGQLSLNGDQISLSFRLTVSSHARSLLHATSSHSQFGRGGSVRSGLSLVDHVAP